MAIRLPWWTIAPLGAKRAGATGHRADEARLQLDGGVGDATLELGVDGAAHRRVEDRRDDPTVNGAERVVVLLARLEGEDDEARRDEGRREADEVGNGRCRELSARDPVQELEAVELCARPEQLTGSCQVTTR